MWGTWGAVKAELGLLGAAWGHFVGVGGGTWGALEGLEGSGGGLWGGGASMGWGDVWGGGCGSALTSLHPQFANLSSLSAMDPDKGGTPPPKKPTRFLPPPVPHISPMCPISTPCAPHQLYGPHIHPLCPILALCAPH